MAGGRPAPPRASLHLPRSCSPPASRSPHLLHPPIVDLGTRIAVKVAAADAAIDNTGKVDTAARAFKLTGARRQLIDKLNALRKATYGILAEMPHKHPELKLAATFADRFFRTDRPMAPSRPPTTAELKIEMDARQADLDKATADYQKALQVEADLAAKKDEDAAIAKEIEDAEAALAKEKERVAALKAKLGK